MTEPAADSETRDLVEELRKRVEGEVRFDKMTRVLYSTDASIYQIEPLGVVLPRTEEDVIAVVETANRHQVPVLPRGGGTSLAGQAVGRAVVVDFSKYMRDVLEVNAEEGWVRTQPGIVLDELNHGLRPHGLHFAPDPSTSNRGNVGGALGNNSCGAHSIVWGKTVDNVLEINAVLSNGDTATLGPVTGDHLEAKTRGETLEAQIYRSLVEVAEANREEVEARFPKIQRRVSGYNLDELVSSDGLDLARFVVGSEGTLLSITEAKLRIVPLPKAKALAVLHFRGLIESMEATVLTLEMGPAAVELVDSMIIRQARDNLEYSRMTDFIDGDPEVILLVEMTGESLPELEAKLDRLEERMGRSGLSYSTRRLVEPADQAKVWAVRKAGLGLMMNVRGEAKPIPFVEDTAVAPEALPEYVRRFNQIVSDHGTSAGYYGHASVGCLHIRPLINLKLAEDVERMVSIATQVSDLVLEFGGAMSGEHGDGLARSAWNEKMFGTQLYNAFREVKRAFDPKGIMNPGKIVDAPSMAESLRVTPATRHLEIETGLGFATEGGLGGAAEMCNGQGACRKVLSGTMCPSYMVTRDEEHSTRGRANALRAAITGVLPVDSLTSKRLYEVMDLCLACKGCKAECPSNVDVAKLKYEFLDRYHRTNGYSLRNRLFGNISGLGRLGSFFAPVSNWSLRSGAFKRLLEDYVGIDRRRDLPPFASQTFTQWFHARQPTTPATSRGRVVLFPDTFTNYNHPNIGRAAVALLEHMGYEVVLPRARCCGRPMLSNGMLDRARANARFNVESVYPLISEGAKLVGLEPSCILSFRDDYLDLLDGDSRARAVADATMLTEEFVLYARRHDGARLELNSAPGKIMFHGHCHQKALVGTGPAMEVLGSIPGCDAQEIPSGCCGMAGSFGFEKEHYETSMRIGEQSLFGPIRSAEGEFEVVSDGVSCRQQIEDGTGVRAKHLVEVLAEAL